MTSYHWPGNVRELENEIERALTLAWGSGKIDETCLSPKLNSPTGIYYPIGNTGLTLKEATQQMELRMIKEALKQTKGNRTQAAKLLGLTRQGLLNKVNRYKIE
jgi:transcriptional regulator with PAS, ATPase and Fis domain